ncbi:hypothetical protein MNBD_GAMMA03-1111 [hydrothermal vent metagenome]|uniref:Uncharacterized protein n=1 Tax=hydrothermal vent metagenome TaxID=652676 RepID=A0A3B0VVZ5_9ZZZZ
MQTVPSQYNWFENHNSIHRQVIAFVVALMIVALLLLIPVRIQFATVQQATTIVVELTRAATIKPDIKPVVMVKKIKPKVVVSKPVTIKPAVITPKVIIQHKPVIKATSKLPASGVIFNSAYGKDKLYPLDKDFQMKTGDAGDFKFKVAKPPKWNRVTKLIDEDLDRPEIEMAFYSPGIVGSTERLLDKVTYKKKFTTRYGTKINCVLFVLMPVCSWK